MALNVLLSNLFVAALSTGDLFVAAPGDMFVYS